VAVGSTGTTVNTVFLLAFVALGAFAALGAFGFRFSGLGAVAPPADVNKLPNQDILST
jgi:hypothetical protein